MGPVLDAAWAQGIAPYLDGTLAFEAAFTAALEPFRAFMLANVRENDLMLFAAARGRGVLCLAGRCAASRCWWRPS